MVKIMESLLVYLQGRGDGKILESEIVRNLESRFPGTTGQVNT